MALPERQGLYDPANEHDACGVGFVANIKGRKSHEVIEAGLQILVNLDHRGAVGADPLVGDGAGILIQIPDALYRAWAAGEGINLPPAGEYAVAMCFLPGDDAARNAAVEQFEHFLRVEKQPLIGWRDVPTNTEGLGEAVLASMPVIRQAFIGRGPKVKDQDAHERKLLAVRKQTQNPLRELAEKRGLPGVTEFYMPSLSTRTVVYKGLLLADQVGTFYQDLQDERTESALALVHQRFSTNTFPSWRLAHPYRFIAHNGEINTVRGNVNWMNSRRRTLESDLLGPDLNKMWPLIPHGQSDTACLDNALELLVAGGYPLAHAMMMLIPEAWAGNPLMSKERRAFYEYHAALMEPWDGPAAVAFTDGRQIGATLDRNGLRPARIMITDQDHVIMASESGVLEVPEARIVRKWRLQPGKMLLIDMEEGRIVEDEELKRSPRRGRALRGVAHRDPVQAGGTVAARAAAGRGPERSRRASRSPAGVRLHRGGSEVLPGADGAGRRRSRGLHGLGHPDRRALEAAEAALRVLQAELRPGHQSADRPDPRGAGDEPGLDDRAAAEPAGPPGRHPQAPRGLPADPHRRGPRQDPLGGGIAGRLVPHRHAGRHLAGGGGRGGPRGRPLTKLCWDAVDAVLLDHNILVISDRAASADRIPIPAALATAAVHHHLISRGLRMQTGLVIETGEAREVHHFCVLAGYGAEAVNPYLAFQTLEQIRQRHDLPVSAYEARKNYIKAIGKGVLKVMSKMGISTYQSYCGAQIFDAVGLSSKLVDKYFTGTATTIEGIGLAEIAEESVRRHRDAYSDDPVLKSMLDVGGQYAWRLRGEAHAWTPESVSKLQHAVRGNLPDEYRAFAASINEQSERLLTIRGLMRFKPADRPIPLDEVEPASEIVKRFATGAMSFGSISREAHTNLAIAMNRMGARSNTGEGGEESDRFRPLPNGDSMRSAIKQVASGRFGVTAEYLVNADDIQIKMAQGAKPGEGGQLPGHKVDKNIARVRHSTPGVGLISPPPHHDIYSIEDLAQLIHDLKNVNPGARISVKLVSEVGVGTVAAGVAKARADHVTISGFEGGTGASPLTSLTHAGSPWEIGLAETQQTLLLNGLRTRIAVQVDGGLRTGRDVAIGALLGADEFGFATAPLIASGCIMMRKCHLNTCPVGVATQDPVLRARFTGQPEHVINYFFFVAEELREIMAELGFRTLNEMIGRVDRLDMSPALDHWKAHGVDLSRILYAAPAQGQPGLWNQDRQDHGLGKALDHTFIRDAQAALETGEPVRGEYQIRNINRTAGAMLSGEVAKRYGHAGLPEDTISLKLTGVAGQSFGAFLARGVTLELVGDANDYVGKGLSGGRVVVRQPAEATREPTRNIIVGNTVLYGAIAGEAYFEGVAGERFAVRNSGAVAVVEGVGDHGCEYMTGGVVVVLGDTGRNFAAGMSGGVAYVYDPEGRFSELCNTAMVALERVEPAGPVSAADEPFRPSQRSLSVENNGMGDMLRFDAERLRILIERHRLHTGSKRAAEILENWDDAVRAFVKVMPTDYRRALLDLAAEREAVPVVAAE
nr:glutamate synthase large subunit [Phenylobacterium sp. J367]